MHVSYYISGLVTLSVFTKANEVDEGQIDFIQTLKRSTISVATAKSDFVPIGGIGCIPLNVSMLCMYVHVYTYICTNICMYVCMYANTIACHMYVVIIITDIKSRLL